MEGLYKINLPSSDLSTEETILQIANSLDNLNGIVDDIFSRLMKRISRNVEKTNDCKQRIELCKDKVEQVSGSANAIKVFSSAKYPAVIRHDHYRSVLEPGAYQHRPTPVALSRASPRSADKAINEKLHFYHVKVGQPRNPLKPKAGLRQALERVTTVGELLVFNTDECPYLSVTAKVPPYVPSVSAAVENKEMLEAAPSSIVKRDLLRREVDEYMYAPGMGMVPELDMPLDLPHLTGIAGDIQYSNTSDAAIAPSAVASPTTPSVEVAAAIVADLPDVKVTEATLACLPDVPDAPPVAMATPSLPPPPPPPPPPPSLPEVAPPRDNKREEKSRQGPPPADNAHASLMEAIRKAGGAGRAKLRSAASEDATQAKKPGGGSGGDLMADLHARLSMRRRGISGAERGGGAGGGSVLHTLASVIPEPGEQSTPQQSSSEEDWE